MDDNLPILIGRYWMETTARVSGTAEKVKAKPPSVRVAESGSGVTCVMSELLTQLSDNCTVKVSFRTSATRISRSV
ncbi:MAG TPA: hypothetical protein VFZ63_18815 [Jiangellaceae bacterium]